MGIRITRAQLRGRNCCYSGKDIDRLVSAVGLTIDECAALDIPASDRVWAICYGTEMLWALEVEWSRELRLHAAQSAYEALALVDSPDPRSLAAVDIAKRYAHGGVSDAKRDSACGAAWTAWSFMDSRDSWGSEYSLQVALSSAASAARALTYEARSAAWDAAYAAVKSAAWDAARGAKSSRKAAWEAAQEAAWRAALARLVDMAVSVQ